jgi:hypothetical protein
MGAVFDHIKGYAEQQVIDRLRQRDYARATEARTVALLYWSEAAWALEDR